METSKLIETLRFCGDKESCCTNCPSGDRVTEYTATECLCDLMQKAANAIEELRLQLESHRDSENAIRLEEKQANCDGWISVKDRLPEPETEVLILAERKSYSFKAKSATTHHIVTTGMYEDGKRNTEDSEWWWYDHDFKYDEEMDAYIIPEGWWEYKHYNGDDEHNHPIDDVVTHWMPLPQPPKGE